MNLNNAVKNFLLARPAITAIGRLGNTIDGVRITSLVLGVLIFVAASRANSLSLDQPWILQHIIRLIGLGLITAATIGRFIDKLAAQCVQRSDTWILQTERRTTLLLATLLLSYTFFWCGVTFIRHFYFHSGMDLGNQDQVVWNTMQGRPFARSIEVTNDLADHIRPYLVLLSPIYILIPSPYVLLAFQAFVLSLSVWPLYRIAKRRFNSPTITLVIGFCALAYPPLGLLNRYDFHAEIIAVPLLIAAYERIDISDLKKASCFLALALLGKENIGFSVATLGLLAAFYHKHWRFGLIWAAAGFAYSLAALFIIIPAFRGAPPDALARYHWLGDTPLEMLWTTVSRPVLAFGHLISAENLLTSLQLLAPLGFIPLLGLPILLPALPTLLYNLISAHYLQRTIYYHYMAPVIPFLFIAVVVGLRWLTTRSWLANSLDASVSREKHSERLLRFGTVLLLLATLSSWIYENPVTSPFPHWIRTPEKESDTFLSSLREKSETRTTVKKSSGNLILLNDVAIREGLKHIPHDAYVRTTGNYVPHLSHRTHIETLDRVQASALTSEVEAIFLNLKLSPTANCVEYLQNLQWALHLGFGVTFYRDSVLLVQKGKGDFQELRTLLASWPACSAGLEYSP